jgi:hypothetical protein
MFATLLADFKDRVREVDLYFKMLKSLDNDEISIVHGTARQVVPRGAPPADWGPMLKGASYLVLYNLVEGFIRRGFQEMFDSIKADALSAIELTELLRKQWIEQRNRTVSAFDGSPKVYMKIANTLLEEIVAKKAAELHREYLPISGNLDAQVIRDVCDGHGVPYKVPKTAKGGASLATVKSKRNSLAHGNESFQDCGKLLTAAELIKAKNEVVVFTRSILGHLAKFATKRKYKMK